ncbi:MAG: hypothetical protein HYV26_01310 [Candidatus Hydrogenedentes bacterium]|nr:hypothetical protein [Candidatus Hydrogenedentota bacterium]
MTTYVRIVQLDHEIEAQALALLLKSHEIPHYLQSFYDSAYDGMFQAQKGWGVVMAMAPAEFGQQIREHLAELRHGAINEDAIPK